MKLNNTTLHLTFWVGVLALLTLAFGSSFGSYLLSFYFSAMLLPAVVGSSYFFNFYLVPHFLLKKRYGRFFLYTTYMLIVSFWLEMLAIFAALVILADYNIENLGPLATNVFVMGVILYFIVLMKAFFLLVRRTHYTRQKTHRLKAEKKKFLKGALTVKSDRRNAKIQYDDIEYLESMGDYVKIKTTGTETVITRERISHLDKALPSNFLRIHRSYIVNTDKIDYFSKTEIQVNGITLPISRTYKDNVTQMLGI